MTGLQIAFFVLAAAFLALGFLLYKIIGEVYAYRTEINKLKIQVNKLEELVRLYGR